MATLTLNPKYVDILQNFGNLEEIVEEALHHYVIERINERIEQARQEVLSFEARYGMTYEQFRERTTTDEAFLEYLEKNRLMWERDLNAWEFYTEDLSEWLGRLKNISKP